MISLILIDAAIALIQEGAIALLSLWEVARQIGSTQCPLQHTGSPIPNLNESSFLLAHSLTPDKDDT
jgi:hypothetical protein